MKLTLEQVYALMEKLASSGLGEVSVESEGVKVKIKAKEPAQVVQTVAQGVASPAPVSPQAAETAPALSGKVVKSPIVGTFYQASSPDKEPFIHVGDSVKKGDTLFIIESMKLMNEVASDFDGKVAEILVENGSPVEFGQPILRLE